jgi:hypothetical protein
VSASTLANSEQDATASAIRFTLVGRSLGDLRSGGEPGIAKK